MSCCISIKSSRSRSGEFNQKSENFTQHSSHDSQKNANISLSTTRRRHVGMCFAHISIRPREQTNTHTHMLYTKQRKTTKRNSNRRLRNATTTRNMNWLVLAVHLQHLNAVFGLYLSLIGHPIIRAGASGQAQRSATLSMVRTWLDLVRHDATFCTQLVHKRIHTCM